MIRTITLEVEAGLENKNLLTIQRLLNERLAGLTFSEIKKTISERLKSVSDKEINDAWNAMLLDFKRDRLEYIKGLKEQGYKSLSQKIVTNLPKLAFDGSNPFTRSQLHLHKKSGATNVLL